MLKFDLSLKIATNQKGWCTTLSTYRFSDTQKHCKCWAKCEKINNLRKIIMISDSDNSSQYHEDQVNNNDDEGSDNDNDIDKYKDKDKDKDNGDSNGSSNDNDKEKTKA